jgi:DNA-binding transcriptional LysR family regulator
MNWDDIKLFLEVARSERLSIAAKRLAIDASTLSRRLHKLEESLATKLFERTIDGHVLTSDGTKLLEYARRMEVDAGQAFDNIKEQKCLNSGRVRIGVTEAFGSFFIAPNLMALKQKFPNIQIELVHFARDVKLVVMRLILQLPLKSLKVLPPLLLNFVTINYNYMVMQVTLTVLIIKSSWHS